MSPVTRNRMPVYTSRCIGLDRPLRGSAAQIAEKYEDLSVEALKAKDDMQARIFSQHAHHWRKVERGEA